MQNNHRHPQGNANANLLCSKRKQETPVEVIKEKQAIITNGILASRETMNNNTALIVSAGKKWTLLITVVAISVVETCFWFISPLLPTTFGSTVKLSSEKNKVFPQPTGQLSQSPTGQTSEHYSHGRHCFLGLFEIFFPPASPPPHPPPPSNQSILMSNHSGLTRITPPQTV